MVLKLLSLQLKNFKSITDFTLNLDGKSATISAQNAAGKTTLADGFFWLLTGSDSTGRAKFGIITQDAQGDEKRGLDAVVSAEFENDRGKVIRIERRLCQKWTKKRGQAQQEFGGHETKFSWDDVPIKKKEFESKLAEIIPLNLVRVLADVHFFNDTLKSEDRRNILLDLIGSVGDGQIIDAYPELKSLPEILDGRSPEDVKKILAAQRKAANDQLKEMPIRIDTLKKTLADAEELDIEELEGQIRIIDSKLEIVNEEILNIKNGSGIARLRVDRINLENQLSRNKAEYEQEKKGIEYDIKDFDIEIGSLKMRLETYKREYFNIKKQRPESSQYCYACGQPLTAAQLSENQEKFEAEKKSKLAEIDVKGTQARKRLDDLEENKAKRLDAIKSIGESADIEEIESEIESINAKISDSRNTIESDLTNAELEIDKLNEEKKALQYQHARAYQYQENQKTIEEYEAQLSKAAVEFEAAEHAIYILEQYSMRRAEFVEDSVSDKFLTVKWRLFDTQINQGIKEICEATVGGIDYSTNLNTGAKINAGLDCINVLSQHYKIELPIFVDNAESVTSWLDSERQIIRLVADGNYKKLEVNNATSSLPADN